MIFLVLLKNREIVVVKSLKSKKKEADTNFVLLCQSRSMVGQSQKLNCIDQSRFYIFSHPRESKNV